MIQIRVVSSSSVLLKIAFEQQTLVYPHHKQVKNINLFRERKKVIRIDDVVDNPRSRPIAKQQRHNCTPRRTAAKELIDTATNDTWIAAHFQQLVQFLI